MEWNTILREIKIDNLKVDLDLLENLSKKISDLIYKNEFSQVPFLDGQRRILIEKIKKNETQKNHIKKRIKNIVENNIENIKITQQKLIKFSKNYNKFNKRLKAYSLNKWPKLL